MAVLHDLNSRPWLYTKSIHFLLAKDRMKGIVQIERQITIEPEYWQRDLRLVSVSVSALGVQEQVSGPMLVAT